MKRPFTLQFLIYVALFAFSTFETKAQTPPRAARSAPTKLQLDGKNINLETNAYINYMPRVILPKEKRVPGDCSKSGRFIVITTISAADESALPSGIEVNHIWVNHNGSWWEGVFNKDETTASEKTIRAVARDCPQKVLHGRSEDVKFVIAISQNGKTYYLRSIQEKLYGAT